MIHTVHMIYILYIYNIRYTYIKCFVQGRKEGYDCVQTVPSERIHHPTGNHSVFLALNPFETKTNAIFFKWFLV